MCPSRDLLQNRVPVGQFGRCRAEMLSILHAWFMLVELGDWCCVCLIVSLSLDALALNLVDASGFCFKWSFPGTVWACWLGASVSLFFFTKNSVCVCFSFFLYMVVTFVFTSFYYSLLHAHPQCSPCSAPFRHGCFSFSASDFTHALLYTYSLRRLIYIKIKKSIFFY